MSDTRDETPESTVDASDGPTRSFRCPTCRKTADLPVDAPHRPFCSPRCKLIDLGRWLDEEYRISRPLTLDDQT